MYVFGVMANALVLPYCRIRVRRLDPAELRDPEHA